MLAVLYFSLAMIRDPAVAGHFYDAKPQALAAEVDRLLSAEAPGIRARGVLAPHAGYVYSGAVAGAVYARVDVSPRVIVLGPNHTGLGARAALWPGGAWRTPLGSVPIDPGLTGALAGCPLLEGDPVAHMREHSIEVQVPFLQRARPGVTIAALCLGQLDYAECEEIGRAVARAARDAGALVVASSDMSHYIPAALARAKDMRAVERIVALDPRGLHEVVRRERITMCGFIPATVMLVAVKELGASAAELVRYAHSGEVTGDDESVVGYAGIVVA